MQSAMKVKENKTMERKISKFSTAVKDQQTVNIKQGIFQGDSLFIIVIAMIPHIIFLVSDSESY